MSQRATRRLRQSIAGCALRKRKALGRIFVQLQFLQPVIAPAQHDPKLDGAAQNPAQHGIHLGDRQPGRLEQRIYIVFHHASRRMIIDQHARQRTDLHGQPLVRAALSQE
jgi:hypothetical protein